MNFNMQLYSPNPPFTSKASGPPPSAFIGVGAYDSSDSGGGLSYDTQSNSSFGSSSPPTRDHRFARDGKKLFEFAFLWI